MDKTLFFEEVLINQKNAEIIQTLNALFAYLNEQIPFTFNPILLKGKTETGKSHLVKSLCKFYPKVIKSIKSGDLLFLSQQEIKEKFELEELTKVFIFDDIQSLAKNKNIAEQVTYHIENLITKNIIIIATLNTDENCLELPKSLESKISMGLCFTMQEPDLDIRVRYIQQQTEQEHIKLTKEQCLNIARRSSGFRNIQVILNHIKLYIIKTNKMPDANEIERIISKQGQNFVINPDAIISIVAQEYGYTVKDLKGKKRFPRIVEARHLAIYLCREILGETYMEIGKIFGGKDHSTIAHSIKKIEDLRVTNKIMNNLVTEVTNQCKKHILYVK